MRPPKMVRARIPGRSLVRFDFAEAEGGKQKRDAIAAALFGFQSQPMRRATPKAMINGARTHIIRP